MTVLLLAVALPGIAAVLYRWTFALIGAVKNTVERIVAGQIADSRAQRGDISGMSEAAAYRQKCAARQVRSFGWLAVWSFALFAPWLLPGTLVIYMLLGLLWLAPAPKSTAVQGQPS